MLEKNRLQPPRSFETAAVGSRDMFHSPAVGSGPLFVSAEDFDATGILAGIDPSASSYWWMPELQGRALWLLAQGQADAGGTPPPVVTQHLSEALRLLPAGKWALQLQVQAELAAVSAR